MVNAHHCLQGFVVAAIVGAATVPDATARPQTLKQAEVATRGSREAKDITYGDWRKLCFKAGGAKVVCRTSITGTFPTGQMAVRIDLIEREGDRGGRLQVFVPVGMYLQDPVKLTIDQASSFRVPYSWCLTNACIAADVADPTTIRHLDAGKLLVMELVDSNLLTLTTSLPLAQFGPVHKGAPAQTLEQDIDE